MTGRRGHRGFTLTELLVVVTLIGIASAVMAPRMRISPARRVREAARLLGRDIELVRGRALATKRVARLVIDPAAGTYQGFRDDDNDGLLAESATEADSLRGFGPRTIDDQVEFGLGSATQLPELAGVPPVTFTNNRIDFSARGVTAPFGTQGVAYLRHRDDPTVVYAVAVSGAGGVTIWTWRGGIWVR